MPRCTDKTTPQVVTTGTEPTVQLWTDKTWVRSHPLWDGIHDENIDLEAIQISKSHDLDD